MTGYSLVNTLTGKVLPARCNRVTCTHCVHHLAMRRAAAIAYSAPTRALLLTQVGDDWGTIRRRTNRVREYLDRAGVEPGEVSTFVEANPRGTGHHVHQWQHSGSGRDRPIPVRLLSECAERAGCGPVVRINRVRTVVGASQYGLKGVTAMGYGLKGIDDLEQYLDLNGGRLSHQSRGFFRSRKGSTLSVRGAEALAVEEFVGRDRLGEWEVVSDAWVEARRSATAAPGI